MSRELWDVALGFNLTDLHFLSLECAPQEVGPVQTRRGCLVLFLQKILVGLKALAKKHGFRVRNDVKFTVFVWSAFKMWVWSKNSLPFAEFGDL